MPHSTDAVLKLFRQPSSPSKVAIGIAVFVALAGAALFGAFGLDTGRADQGAVLYGGIILPPVALILWLAAWREKRVYPKLAMTFVGSFLFIIGAILACVSFIVSIRDHIPIFIGVTIVIVIVAMLPAIRAYSRRRKLLAIQHVEMTRAIIEVEDGRVPYALLQEKLGVTEQEAEHILRQIENENPQYGERENEWKLYIADKQRTAVMVQLKSELATRGSVALNEFARRQRLPQSLIETWLGRMASRGNFTGYIDGRNGEIFSADAVNLTTKQRCPNCGGELSLTGQGVIRCPYCDTKIFIERDSFA